MAFVFILINDSQNTGKFLVLNKPSPKQTIRQFATFMTKKH